MNVEDNGLTLQGVAQRLEALQHQNAENAQRLERLETLERENEQMRSENAGLRNEVPALRGSEMRRSAEPASESEVQVSRRWMLRRAGAAAAGLMVAGALTQRGIREAKAAAPFVNSTNTANRGAVEGSNESSDGYGVWGNCKGIGVRGTSPAPNLGAVEGHNSGGGRPRH